MKFDLANLKEKAGSFLGKASQMAKTAGAKVTETTDKAAHRVAEKVSSATGKEITASQVKKAAAVAGVAALAVGVVSQLNAGGGAATGGSGGSGGWGNDVTSQAHRFFAENGGSLNIETQYVDQDGCVLY